MPILLAAALLAGCGGDDDRGPATAAPAATATPTATAATPAVEGIDPLEGASTDAVTAPPMRTETALLTAVRAARHEGYDRVVFEFDRALPGYEVGYTERPVHQDGSGDEVEVGGEHVVVVRMENALDADLEKEGAPLTYAGPTRSSPSTPAVAELVRIGGFEGVLTWAIGLRARADFRVHALSRPDRLVVDFRNH